MFFRFKYAYNTHKKAQFKYAAINKDLSNDLIQKMRHLVFHGYAQLFVFFIFHFRLMHSEDSLKTNIAN